MKSIRSLKTCALVSSSAAALAGQSLPTLPMPSDRP